MKEGVKNSDRKKFFYKYVTVQGAASILEKLSLKWTCPIYFNDPFDIRQELGLGFDENEFFEANKNRSIDLLYSQEPVYKRVEAWANMRNNCAGLTRQDHEIFWLSQKDGIIQGHRDRLQYFQKSWKDQIRKYRVLCLSENEESLLMWAHYADSHPGGHLKIPHSWPGQNPPGDRTGFRFSSLFDNHLSLN